jgi:hypothetical protein
MKNFFMGLLIGLLLGGTLSDQLFPDGFLARLDTAANGLRAFLHV